MKNKQQDEWNRHEELLIRAESVAAYVASDFMAALDEECLVGLDTVEQMRVRHWESAFERFWRKL